METRIRVRAVVLATTIALAGSLAGTPVTAAPEDETPETIGPEVIESIAEPDVEPPTEAEPAPAVGRGLYVRPDLRQGRVGDLRQFTAWLCDVPEVGVSPFGADEKPLTRDDDCHRVLKARWTVSDRSGARLLTATGPLVKVEALTAGADVTVTAKRGDRAGTAVLEVLEPDEEPTPVTPAVVQPKTAKPKPSAVKPAGTSSVGPLLGTIGFRSAATGLLGKKGDKGTGLYVTTYIKTANNQYQGRNEIMKARSNPNLLTLELGLFKAGDGKFKLLGENGLWLTRKKDGVMYASASKWGNAWGFKVTRVPKSDRKVCLWGFKSGKKYLMKLKSTSNPVLVAKAGAACTATGKLAHFVTDDLPPKPKPVSHILKPSGVDPMVRVRFVPPDRQVTLSATKRQSAINAIDIYFNAFKDYNKGLRDESARQLGMVTEPLKAEDRIEFAPQGEGVDWLGISFDLVSAGLPWLGALKPVANLTKYKWVKTVIKHVTSENFTRLVETGMGAVELGVASDQQVANGNLGGARYIPDVTGKIVNEVNEIQEVIGSDYRRRRDNSSLMHALIKLGCGKASAACDRRLAQWLKDPPQWPDQDGWLEDNYIFAKKKAFLEQVLPIRGRLYAMDGPYGWTHVAPESPSYDRAYHIIHYLGDEGDGLESGFGRKQSSVESERYLLYTNVWRPWYHVSYQYVPAGWRERPKAFGWAIGLKGEGDDIVTALQEPTFYDLFEPFDPEHPLDGGLGLSYKEVACEWLTNAPHAHYHRYTKSNGDKGKKFDPCHFSFYDLSATTPTLVNDKSRWVRDDDTKVEVYSKDHMGQAGDQTYAISMWLPELVETRAGRDPDDPDIFSWMIPHLEFGPAKAIASRYPDSTKKEDRKTVPVYFANLTKGPITVHKVRPDGVITGKLLWIPKWDDIDKRYAAKEQGAIPYRKGTKGIKRLPSYVGATYVVRAADTGQDIGSYTVKSPPAGMNACRHEKPGLAKCQVAEIHGHFDGPNNDGILDR